MSDDALFRRPAPALPVAQDAGQDAPPGPHDDVPSPAGSGPASDGRPQAPAPEVGPGDLVASGVTVRYGGLTALLSVDLVATPGQVLAVVGPSGAGKTSLLWVLAGALQPDEGSVTLAGAPVGGRDDAVSHGIVLIPQGNGLAAVLTAGENVTLPLLARGADAAEVRQLAGEALSAVGLDEQEGHLVEELSGGQQQRVAVARGLAAQGRVVLADEPTSELDHGSRERILTLLQEEARRGAVVVMATHDRDTLAWADRRIDLDEGRVVGR